MLLGGIVFVIVTSVLSVRASRGEVCVSAVENSRWSVTVFALIAPRVMFTLTLRTLLRV